MNIIEQFKTESTSTDIYNKKRIAVLLGSVFIIAACSLLYELLISTISSYFLGSSITQFSITIGLFMTFMGVGSFLSKFIKKNLLEWFLKIEILLGIVGGLSAFILYFTFSLTKNYYLTAFIIIGLLGTLIGLEIPLVTRIINKQSNLRVTVANVFSYDYIGALIASLIFPLILLPYLGVMRTAFIVGFINLFVALINVMAFKNYIKRKMYYFQIVIFLMIALIAGFIYSFKIVSYFEQYLYQNKVIFTKQTPYQRIVVTSHDNDLRLYIDGNLQFCSVDEHRYHEPLVHLPMLLAENRENILVLGGGDGLAAREILKYKDVNQIDIVDIDVGITDLAVNNDIFTSLNKNSFKNNKVHIHNTDAYKFLEEDCNALYSVVIIDLPDPNDTSLGKLYSKEFYTVLKSRLAKNAVVITQSTSPYVAKKAYWCIKHTIDTVFKQSIPLNVYVPSFGWWGFVLTQNNYESISNPKNLTSDSVVYYAKKKISEKLNSSSEKLNLKFLNLQTLEALFIFDNDIKEVPTEINTLNTQKLVKYYEEGIKNYQEHGL